jgi:pullulanase/glycogen debranching enzyme
VTKTILEGAPNPLGARWDGNGTNFVIFSANATKVEIWRSERPPSDRPRANRNLFPAQELMVPLPINAASQQDFAAMRQGRTP